MTLQTVINWRPYPEQKPDHTLDGEWLLILIGEDPFPTTAWYNEGPETFHGEDDEEIQGVVAFSTRSDTQPPETTHE